MSVPRPAMLVAMVMAPGRPASATMCASRSCCLALSTSCGIFSPCSSLARRSEVSIEVVPTSTGWPRFAQSGDVLENRLKLIVLGEKYQIGLVLADHRLVGGDHHHLQAVDLLELERLGVRRARHAGQLLVQPEIILEGDGRDGLIFLADLHPFLGLDRLMQAVGPAPTLHGAAGELIDDDHFALAHDVLDIALVQRMRAQCRIQVMHQADVGGVVKTFAFPQQARSEQQLLDALVAGLGQRRLLLLLIHPEIAVDGKGIALLRRQPPAGNAHRIEQPVLVLRLAAGVIRLQRAISSVMVWILRSRHTSSFAFCGFFGPCNAARTSWPLRTSEPLTLKITSSTRRAPRVRE